MQKTQWQQPAFLKGPSDRFKLSVLRGTDFDIMDLTPDASYLRDFYNGDWREGGWLMPLKLCKNIKNTETYYYFIYMKAQRKLQREDPYWQHGYDISWEKCGWHLVWRRLSILVAYPVEVWHCQLSTTWKASISLPLRFSSVWKRPLG